jgi:protocatechuate 3,4-dioxygenase beta subunit
MQSLLASLTLCLALIPASAFGAVRGVVFDAQGEPIAKARITAHRGEAAVAQRMRLLHGEERAALGTAATDESGAFAIDAKFAGVVELFIQADGFAPGSQWVLAGNENVFVTLNPAAMRTGHVTANGKPVADALVIGYQRSDVWKTRTKSDGTYTIPDPKGWCSLLVILHPDFAPKSIDEARTLDADLEGGATISGSVTDAAGRPVAKANVFAGAWSTTTTAEDGTFALRHVAEAEKKITAAEGDSFGSAARGAKVAIRIEPRPSISGTVRDADQHPLEGMPVVAFSMSMSASNLREPGYAISDVKGNYTILNCDAGENMVLANGVTGLDFGRAEVNLKATRNGRADLTAKKSEFLTGIVVDERRQPVAGATVMYSLPQIPLMYALLADAATQPNARSGSDGKFRLTRVPRGTVNNMDLRLQALHRDYAVGTSEVLGDDTRSVTIVLPKGIELQGIVTDAEGAPVSGASVALLQDPSGAVPLPIDSVLAMGAVRGFTESDADGRFSVRLNAASHDLGVWKAEYGSARVGDVVMPRAAETPLKITLEKGVELRGRVTTKSKDAQLTGSMYARGAEGLTVETEVADDGAFAFAAIRPGNYVLRYHGENGRSHEQETKAPDANVIFELPATGEIRGRVIDEGTRAPLRNYTLRFETQLIPVEDQDSFVMQVPPATGELTVEAEGYLKRETTVTVTAEKTAEVTIALTRGRALSGRVTDEQGKPIEQAWVMLEGNFTAMDATEQDGQFHLNAVPREAFTLEVRADGHLKRTFENPAGEHDIRLDVVLSTGRRVAGHVVSSDGAPVEGAAVHAYGAQPQNTTTDATGAFVVGGLGDGAYRLRASRDELESDEVAVGSEIPTDVVITMKPSAGAGKLHGLVKGFAGSNWFAAMVRTEPGTNFSMIGRDGKYAIDGVPAGEVTVQAWAQSTTGAEASTAPVKVTVLRDGDVEANLEFRDDVTIRGVVTESGVPAPGRIVRFRSETSRWGVKTGDGGVYQLTGVEPGKTYDVEVEGGGRTYSTKYRVTGSSTFDIHIEWLRVEGRVIDSMGAPVEGAEIQLAAEGSSSSSDAKSDTSGGFSFSVARGPHVLTIAKEDFATSTQRVEPGAAPLLVKLVRTDGLHVRLVDARDGHTLDGYVVAVDAAGLQVARADEAQKDGTMLVPVADGAYRISVSANGYASQSVRVSVPHQGELRMALTPGGTLIIRTDRVSDDLVKLVMPNGEEYVRCQCNGIAEIRLTGTTTTVEHVAPGNYTMQVIDERGLVKTSYPVTIAEGKTTEAEIRVPE